MRLFLLASGVVLVPTVAQKKCHSIMPGVKDEWCNQNCNFQPPFCPASICNCGGPAPVPPGPVPPTPPPSPPPPPGPKPDLPDEIIGYYSWNWGAGSLGPPGSNMGVAFTGLVDVTSAIGAYSPDAGCPALKGLKTLSLGGGNAAGVFNEAGLKGIIRDVAKIKEAGYSAVIFDVEEVPGPSSVMGPLFSKATAAAHQAGLISAITTSHSAPFQCDTPQDAINLVKEWCADPNLDIISPQLYSSGYEAKPELVPTNFCVAEGCTWDLYKDCKAEIAPSIIKTSHYEEVKAFFDKTIGRKMKGYYMWAQTRGREDSTITV